MVGGCLHGCSRSLPASAGPAGPRGPQGPRGNTPKIVCTAKIRHNQVISVTCKEVGGSRDARAVVALTRGKRIVGWGDGPLSRSIALHHRVRLRGKYVVTVMVAGGPQTKLKVRV